MQKKQMSLKKRSLKKSLVKQSIKKAQKAPKIGNSQKSIFTEVLEDISPNNKDEISLVNSFTSELDRLLKKNNLNAKTIVGGSFAKNTYLRGDHDVDVFVAFDLKHKDDPISDLLEKSLKSFSPERLHGSRDYFQLIKDSLHFEIVPVLNIKKPGDSLNVTDFSPLHVKWMEKNGKKFCDDIRLAKRFCKSCRVYGAESYIRGFSGHVLDILVVYYKGFPNLLKAAAKWNDKTVIDFYKVFKGRALQKLNPAKIISPLILIDPVQPDRNAASALSDDCYNRFIASSKAFLSSPSRNFFIDHHFIPEEKRQGHTLIIEFNSLPEKIDVAGSKMVQAFDHLKGHFKEFGILDSGWEWDKRQNGFFWFVLRSDELSQEVIHEGPPTDHLEHCKFFKQKWPSAFTKNNRLYVSKPREFRTPNQIIAHARKDSYITSRITLR